MSHIYNDDEVRFTWDLTFTYSTYATYATYSTDSTDSTNSIPLYSTPTYQVPDDDKHATAMVAMCAAFVT